LSLTLWQYDYREEQTEDRPRPSDEIVDDVPKHGDHPFGLAYFHCLLLVRRRQC